MLQTGYFGNQIVIVGVLKKIFLLPAGARVKNGWFRRLNTSLKEYSKMKYLNVHLNMCIFVKQIINN